MRRIAIFLVAANLPILDIKSPITAQRLPEAHCAASLFLAAGCCLLLVSSPVFGKAIANKVEMDSTTIRLVSEGGKEEDECVRRANR